MSGHVEIEVDEAALAARRANDPLKRVRAQRDLRALSGHLDTFVAVCGEIVGQVRAMPVIDGEQQALGAQLESDAMAAIEHAQALNYRLEVFHEKGIL